MVDEKNLLEGFSAEDIAAMAGAYHQIASNPETREATLRLQKKANPKARFPEIDIKDAAVAASTDLRKKIDEQAADLIQMKAEQRIRDEREKLAGQGFKPTDIEAIEKEMIEARKNGTVLTYESAARYYKQSTQLAVPSAAPHVTDLNNTMPSGAMEAFSKGGMNGLKKLTRERAAKALDDITSGRIKLH